MINNVSSALNAYQQALSRINANEQKIAEVEQPKVSGFGNMVKSAVQDVVLAVSNAEVALETVVAVRDTAIKAYNTIMQMPI